jgi:hypothetical protein
MGQEFPQTLRGFHVGGGMMQPGQPQPPPAGVRPPRVSIPTDSPMHQYQVRLLIIRRRFGLITNSRQRANAAFSTDPRCRIAGTPTRSQCRRTRGTRTMASNRRINPDRATMGVGCARTAWSTATTPRLAKCAVSRWRGLRGSRRRLQWSTRRLSVAATLQVSPSIGLVAAWSQRPRCRQMYAPVVAMVHTTHNRRLKRTTMWSSSAVDRKCSPVVQRTSRANLSRCVA